MELMILGVFFLGLFLIIYPYLALSKIWSLLEKIEKHNAEIVKKITEAKE